jgi:hypothetical protein
MAKSIRDIPKKRGRGRPKTTGRGEGVLLRLHKPLTSAIDDWAKRQDDKPSRPEAIRRLLVRALSTAEQFGSPSKTGARLAEKLASREIEGMVDQSHPKAEQQRRKRRLLKGPGEFRDMRGDQPPRRK